MFELARTVTPEQPDSALLVRITDLKVDPSGRFIVADYSESNVKVYAADGTLQHVIGRRGHGPSEFPSAQYLVLVGQAHAYVGGSATNRLSLLNLTDGTVEETILLDGLSGVFGLVASENGSVFASVRSFTDGGNALAHLDGHGNILDRLVPIEVKSAAARAAWNIFVGQSIGVINDTIWILPEVSDTAWTFDPGTGSTSRIGIPLVNYAPPQDQPDNLANALDFLEWRRAFDGPLAPLQVGSHVAVPFVRGSRNDGDRISLAIRSPAGEWHTLTNAPAVIGAFADTLVAIADPTGNTLQFVLYSLRSVDRE
ncbi:MAG: 6-bladed beta-propeller [Rhodothermales bacterium]